MRKLTITAVFIGIFGLIILAGCATMQFAKPYELVAPTPIYGNSGKYMSPYTQDDVLAEWTDKAINAKMGAAIGRYAGAKVGQKALEQVPFIGGFLGQKAGEAAGRAIAIKMSGGWNYIKNTSDISFDSIDDMAVYLYVKYSDHEHYQQALTTTWEIYPELKKRYLAAIRDARHR